MPRPGPRPFECVRRSWHSDRHQPLRGSIIQQIFRLVHENHSPGTKKNREWQEKLAVVVLKSEEILYSKANSEAEYKDPETLWDRLNDAIDTIIRKDETTETGDFLHPCVEAALNLGCIPVKSSRSQRNANTMSYLSPRKQDSGPNTQNVPNVRRPPDGASQTHTFSETNNDTRPVYNVAGSSSSFYPQNVPRQMMSFENRSSSSSVYPLYHGFHIQPQQMGFDNAHRKPNNIILGKPVFQAAASGSQTGCQERSFLFEKDGNGSKKESRPELVECDLSLRLGLVSSNEKRLTFGDDVDPGPRSKEFSFFPLSSEVEEGGNMMTDVRKRKTVGESQSFLHFERDFDRINDRMKRQGL
ncbi:putative coactivator CBP, KIX domain superfamily [Helianthus annuus]|nr:putative coactivator CBP, KIX domain superfamily [Helianthus annuus]KAJ0673645.1 putative coactivator CBP, KIX domain superfamily [Helianthus annuus]KAJ0677001.1 putative coactivator CBP, KIX domain superfamily [Helianthus annuus]